MNSPMRRAPAMILALLVASALRSPSAGAQERPLYTFHESFWNNLHHLLHALGNERNGAPEAKRSAVAGAPREIDPQQLRAEESTAWNSAIEVYARSYAARDLTFDAELVAITRRLVAARDAANLPDAGLPADLWSALRGAAPTYRRLLWERDQERNRRARENLESWIVRHGRPFSETISRAWGVTWPVEGVPIELSSYAGWAGAYSTDGGLIVFSSAAPNNSGSSGFEIVVHEAMHQWDQAFQERLEAVARSAKPAGRALPPRLSHSLLFYGAGDAVAREIPGHVPYAKTNGLWAGPLGHFGGLESILDQHWRPYLRDQRGFEEAIVGILDALEPAAPARPAPTNR